MKISYEWLRGYINTKIRSRNLASVLTMAGHEVTAIEEKGKDFIFEIEVTPNRPDCLCHIGLAREVSAVTGKGVKIPRAEFEQKKPAVSIKVELADKIGCPRYSARVIKGVKVAPSPIWLLKRINSIGLRPVNNIVDITNFVLFETGQPLHAFDLDTIEGDKIIVRRARAGEKMITIDGVERQLQPHMLVIADIKKPVAIAGIMGAKGTEVTEETKDILLESAYFDPVVIRRAALSLGLSTDSSYRFERGVDPAAVVLASDRATSLISNVAKAGAYNLIDVGIKKRQPLTITLRPARLNNVLGTDLKTQRIKDILKRLNFGVKDKSGLGVSVPSFRGDVTKEQDLIEEVARIYGYEKITPQPPKVIKTDEDEAYKDIMRKLRLTKAVLSSSGFFEVITYSLINRQLAAWTQIPQEGVIEIANPLSKEQEIMRQSLLPGLFKVVSYNINRQIQDIKVFELSEVYFQKEGVYNEEPYLGFAKYDKVEKKSKREYLSSGIFRLKGLITVLGEKLGLADLRFERILHPVFIPEQTLAVLSGDVMLGTIGKVKAEVLEPFDIKGDLFAGELNFKTLIAHSSLSRFYEPLPRFPYSYRDISFAVDSQVLYQDIIGLIKETGGPLVKEVELLSEYYGEQIPANQRGLAVRVIYQTKERTLTEEELNSLDKSIRENLTKTFSANLR